MPEIKEPPLNSSMKSTTATNKATNGAWNHDDPVRDAVFDPLTPILAAFDALPARDLDALFKNFRKAATERDLRQLLDTISDWAATAELYANPTLRKEFEEARAGRQEVSEWLSGKYE